ncbi:MAG: hypothetical protein HY566_01930, partial [Candidatus Kerfeldbacteria bacterium]|nr:hypothetical protein [Candidatus Kerfeldbacteria bacterium]
MPDILAMILLAACYGFIAWRSLPHAVALFVFLLPAYQVRFSVFGLPTTALEVMFLALTVVWAARRLRVSRERPSWPWRATTVTLLVAGALAVMVSPDRWAGLGLYRAYVLEPVVLFCIFVDVVRSERSQRLVMMAMSATVVIVGLAAWLQNFHLMPGVEPYASQIPARATSIFAFPTAVGKYVAPICAFFLALVFVRRRNGSIPNESQARVERGIRFLALGTVILGLGAIIFSVSRGAL